MQGRLKRPLIKIWAKKTILKKYKLGTKQWCPNSKAAAITYTNIILQDFYCNNNKISAI